ncbi:MAG: D-ribose pyranase [Thermoanaerobacterium sp.]|nr:D-ribose pyranase [Thermoanaerobacterium sp.]
MKSTGGILNAQLSRIIAETGHKDLLVVTDAGLPIPLNVERVDLAVIPMLPRFLDVLKAVKSEIVVESIMLAEEIKTYSPEMEAEILKLFPNVPVTYTPHTNLKEISKQARACIRSGEFTPYANVIITAGCAY